MKGMFLLMYLPFSAEAMNTFYQGLTVMVEGMTLVIGVLALFYGLIKLMIKLFPDKD
jgi:Oxaloacetate decarboxylase, gamma chain.